MGKSYYEENKEARLAYQNAYYRRNKEERLRKLELLSFLEPDEFEESRKKLARYNADYYRKNRKRIRQQRKNLVESRKRQ